jgi:hypothetical protein
MYHWRRYFHDLLGAKFLDQDLAADFIGASMGLRSFLTRDGMEPKKCESLFWAMVFEDVELRLAVKALVLNRQQFLEDRWKKSNGVYP